MPRTNCSQSIQAIIRSLQNQVANLQAQQQERDPVELVRQNYQHDTQLNTLRLERNRLRVRVADLETEIEDLEAEILALRCMLEGGRGFSWVELVVLPFFVVSLFYFSFYFYNKIFNF